jgi:hypothetical protein
MLMSKSRLEKFLYALYSLDHSDLPTPLSRIEELYKCLVTGEETPTFEPLSRVEKYLMAILGVYDVDSLPNPLSRVEVLLYKLATGDDNLDDVKSFLSEHEELLAEIIRNGGVGGNIDIEYVLYTLSTEFNTLYNTAEKPVKSAILKGNTLVNLLPNKGKQHVSVSGNRIVKYPLPHTLKKNTKYLVYYNVEDISNPSGSNSLQISMYSEDVNIVDFIDSNDKTGLRKHIFTTSDKDFEQPSVWFFILKGETTEVIYDEVMILEYQDGMENWDIPYFEGIGSVKMPVLTTTGKNLFDINGEFIATGATNSINGNSLTVTGEWFTRQVVDLKPNTTYTLSYEKAESDSGYVKTSIYTNGTSAEVGQSNTNKLTFTTPQSFTDISVIFYAQEGGGTNTVTYTNIQLEEGSVATEYEPYKSNILSTSEDIELRGIGEVKDELDLVTGEVTRRIGEVVLDSGRNWSSTSIGSDGTFMRFYTTVTDANLNETGTDILCDKFICKSHGNWNKALECIHGKVNSIHINMLVSKLTSADVSGFKAWLSGNPVTLQYVLKSETTDAIDISTVDQDGNDTELSTFNDITHVTLSSEGLIPEAELEVATKNEEDLDDSIVYTVHTLSEEFNTLNNTAEKPVKSAILKGQTLVNLCDDGVADASDITRFTHNFASKGGTFEQVSDGIKATATEDDTWLIVGYDIRSQQRKTMTIGKKYYGVADVTVHNLTNSDSCKVIFRTSYPIRESTSLTNGRGLVQGVFTHSGVDANQGWVSVGTSAQKAVVGDSFTVHSMSVYEITEEEVNLSYEELANKYPVKCVGMQSVKMPVLTTTGKNLFDGEFELGTISSTNGATASVTTAIRSKNYTKVKGNTDYIMYIGSNYKIAVVCYDENKQILKTLGAYSSSYVFHLAEDVKYIKLRTPDKNGFDDVNVEVSLYEYETGINVSYEPYKSNILTVNEEVKLRGIGDVQDELNLLTGELTERIGNLHPIQLTFGNPASINSNTVSYSFGVIPKIKKTQQNTILCNALPQNNPVSIRSEDEGFYTDSKSTLVLVINKSRLTTLDKDGLLKWLTDTSCEIIYHKSSESIKTVDLSVIDQDGNRTELSTLNDLTHVTLSSEGLIPETELEVAEKITEVAASMLSISREQEVIDTTTNEQSENVDSTMIATTEIYEGLL